MTNYGTILGDFSGQAINIRPEVGWFINYGLVAATNNGAVYINSPNWINPGTMIGDSGSLGWSGLWTNSGTINITNSSLYLGGAFTEAQLGVVNRSAGNVHLTGTLDLAPGSLELTEAMGSWTISGGTMKDGVVNMSGGAVIHVAANSNNRFANMTVNGDVNLPNDDSLLRLSGVVRLNGVLTLSGNRSRLCPEGEVSLLADGGGQVRFVGTGWDVRRINNIGPSTLTLGPGLLVRGGFAEIGPAHLAGGSFWLTIYGTILGDFGGQAINIRPEVGWFIHYGLVAATNNGAVYINSPNWTSPGTMIAQSGTLGWSGLWTNSGTINITNSSLSLGGSFTVGQLGG